MDEDQMALNNTASEAVSESPTEEKAGPEVSDTEAVETESTETEQATEETQHSEGSKKGAQNRIRELSAELKKERAERQSLAEKIAEYTGSLDSSAQAPQYNSAIQPGSEISLDQYEQDISRKADAIVQFRLKQNEVINRINAESQEAIKANPQLDPDSDEFDEELSESITKATIAFARVNPTESIKKFVDGLMKPYKNSINKGVAQAQENIAKQVSQAALRPTQVKMPEKTAEEKSIEELEKELGITQT